MFIFSSTHFKDRSLPHLLSYRRHLCLSHRRTRTRRTQSINKYRQ
ncbi:hypothetical protein MCHI_001901 [Candidatus Magnetoovum chiemensis]|nr:hypothetical protein MCHI_001901 [Candidatus Magnetoovum chiemensis]